MKLIVTGATGVIGAEVIRQALSNPSITSVVALARRHVATPAQLPATADPAKLKTVILEDWVNIPQSVKDELKGAGACIWTLGITPGKARAGIAGEVRKICHDYTMAGLEAIGETRQASEKPCRFIYVSGAMVSRDMNKRPFFMAEYGLMRSEIENHVLAYARSHEQVQAQITKPGIAYGPHYSGLVSRACSAVGSLGIFPLLHVSDLAAAMLNQATNGIRSDTLENAELISLGKEELRDEDYLR